MPPISFDIPTELSVPAQETAAPDCLNEQASLLGPALTDSENEFGFVTEILTETQREALRAALKGSFSPYCRSVGVMEENMRGEINEIAMEYIGDMLIDGDFSVLEDYEAEIGAVLDAE